MRFPGNLLRPVEQRASTVAAEASFNFGRRWKDSGCAQRELPVTVRMADKRSDRAGRSAAATVTMAMADPVVWSFKGEPATTT